MKRFIMALVITVLLASLFLGSCGDDAEETTVDESKYGGTLRVITPMDPTVLGYPAESAGRATYFQYCVLERMIVYAPDVWENQTYEGVLATSYKHESEMSVWTFELREGVKFHDDTPWNAEAAKWNFDLRKEAGNSTTFNGMISADVLDEYTIQLTFESPVNTFEVELATGIYFISPTAFEAAGATQEERIDWARGHPVGTGPFKFVEAVLGSHVHYTLITSLGRVCLEADFVGKRSRSAFVIPSVGPGLLD